MITETTYSAEPNPDYPSKGERRYCVYRHDSEGRTKLTKQFNAQRPAERFAYRLEVAAERRRRTPYLGD